MRTTLLGLLVMALMIIPSISKAADSELAGTWSGSWLPKGGVVDAVTVEIRQQEDGKLTGRFRTPQEMMFSTATFDPKTGGVVLEATDARSGKRYKIDGKLNKLEIKGTLVAGDTTGELLLIKWTYIPR